MRIVVFLCFFSVIYVLAASGEGRAAPGQGCFSGNCHQALTNVKYMHGPVAAEMAGVKACEMCHVASGAKCSTNKGGKFRLKSRELCAICHVKGTGTQHSEQEIEAKCLKCHDPHGSDVSPQMLRADRK